MYTKKDFYLEPVKFIRDLVHGYVYLTKFDLELIDTPEFQRLKDIRQLTCQHVYPAARHTRFEHSLGVLELTRQAVKNIIRNKFIMENVDKELFDEQLQFNASLAALLHDIGHCPFSHLGETEFNKVAVWEKLYEDIQEHSCFESEEFQKKIDEMNADPKKRKGAVHEQLSCILILENLYEKLDKVKENSGEVLYVDFELLISSILGIEYDTSSNTMFEQNKEKNVIVNLINSPIFDMDKLDYIMRDSLCTGIENPGIDTHRLFKNMFLVSSKEYKIVFTHRAEPVLQNMIEARDKLYMYVYNHHVAVFSDFMYSYIFRRLDHNAEDFIRLVASLISDEEYATFLENYVSENEDIMSLLYNKEEFISLYVGNPITNLGIVPKSYLFSPESILIQKRSDSDMLSLLHDIAGFYFDYQEDGNIEESLQQYLLSDIQDLKCEMGIGAEIDPNSDIMTELVANIIRACGLIDKYQKREFLKPWWKTNFEFVDFVNRNFRNDHIRRNLCDWVCNGNGKKIAGDEFRSQIAKHVIAITQKLKQNGKGLTYGLIDSLQDGDFFVIERPARFIHLDAIRKLDIALKKSEILGVSNGVQNGTSGIAKRRR